MDFGGRVLRTVGSGQGAGKNQFSFPFGVAIDPQGRVFVADDINQRVLRFGPQPDYKYKARWGSYGTGPGQLAYPRAIASDAGGQLYVTNTGNDRIDVFDRGGRAAAVVRHVGPRAGPVQRVRSASRPTPRGIRAVADSINGRIELLNPDGSIASVWGSPSPGPTILRRPVAVAFDAAGDAYVLDQRRGRIFVFARGTGLPARTIASQGSGPGAAARPVGARDRRRRHHRRRHRQQARRALHHDRHVPRLVDGAGTVRGVAVTPDGSRTYVSATNNRITVYDAQGGQISQFGGTGSTPGKLSAPAQISLDAGGKLWVADRGNSRIQRFGPDGERLGSFGGRGIGLGQFINPTGVVVDCTGVLTVTDSRNNRVQQFKLTAPEAPPCGPLAPIGHPPPPQIPTLPPPLGPDLACASCARASCSARACCRCASGATRSAACA